jgi:starch synthase (maltosyl-transferring)
MRLSTGFSGHLYYVQASPETFPAKFAADHLSKVAAMGFGHVVFPVSGGALKTLSEAGGAALGPITEICRRHQLRIILDLVSAPAAGIVADDAVPDPRHVPTPHREADLDPQAAIDLPLDLAALVGAGVSGFAISVGEEAPRWAGVIARTRSSGVECRFLAWTDVGTDQAALRDAGFDACLGPAGTLEAWQGDVQVEPTRLPTMTYPERPFGPRLAGRIRHTPLLRRASLRALRLAAAAGDGLLVPMGFEVSAREPARRGPTADAVSEFRWAQQTAPFDLSDEITATMATLQGGAAGSTATRVLSGPGEPVLALFRTAIPASETSDLILVNENLRQPARVLPSPILRAVGGEFGPFTAKPPGAAPGLDSTLPITLDAGETRVLTARRAPPVAASVARLPEQALERAVRAPRLAIEAVTPSAGEPRFPVKRIAGEAVRVEADIIADGHDVTAVALLWRPADERAWREQRMAPLGNDRWAAEFPLDRIGRYVFAVEAWRDVFGTFLYELRKKHAARLDLSVEIEEGRLLVEQARGAARGSVRAELDALLARIAATATGRLDLLLAPETATLMASADQRPFAVRQEPAQPVDAERRAAGFASWYELFPRSQSREPGRHGTFDDVITRLPAIRAMGFDVLYFPPIHPIGRKNRKGRNNSLTPGPDDPGSPYAIGAAEGGHDAIHPELGTIEDFRRLRDAAAEHGLELALDFAIQCAPDHPWLRDHPGWFGWRPDGSIRYAENPPKKYEDIVNVDFYADDAMPALWRTLRDIVAFWVSEGVRLFRVDNPHTKPFPFWEWLIADIRGRDPGVVFLAEAFTRPKVMYRLAKVGFSQSYTYFTWRNTKAELTSYLTELTTTAPRDFFRPHFFVNTPDINPLFLQTSGRPGFLIRAALATTLSGLWGMYNGFELCEAQAVPGKEEYLDSEKYQLRAWDLDRPGNIVAEITRLNRIRHANPALHSHLGLTFYKASNDSILYFAKATPDRGNTVLVAINLDPHRAQDADIEIPLWEWGLPDDAVMAAEDLMRGERFAWHGKVQHIRLDPADSPFAIWRIQPAQEV